MYGIVNRTIVSVKNFPSEDAVRIDEIFLEMIVTILWDDVNGYSYIETSYNYKGYVNKKSLVTKEPNVSKWTNKATHMVIGEYIDILDDISYDSKIIASVVRGSKLIKTDKVNKTRSKVLLPDGKTGWIRNEFLKDIKDVHLRKIDEIRYEIVENALKYRDKQFRWGGKSPLGIDSSGLTSMVYMLSGLEIWRDSDIIDDDLIKIKKQELKYGDLIFGMEHIAIYLGDDKFINASAVDASVVIRNMDSQDINYDEIFSNESTIYACHKLLRG